jgi:hypothetical protein
LETVLQYLSRTRNDSIQFRFRLISISCCVVQVWLFGAHFEFLKLFSCIKSLNSLDEFNLIWLIFWVTKLINVKLNYHCLIIFSSVEAFHEIQIKECNAPHMSFHNSLRPDLLCQHGCREGKKANTFDSIFWWRNESISDN